MEAFGSLFHSLSGFCFNFLNFKDIFFKGCDVLQKLHEKFDVSHCSAKCVCRKLMVDLRCKVVVSWSVICRVGKDHRFCNKVFQCADLINSCMEWFMPKLVSMKCVLWKVLYYFWRCVAFSDTNCYLVFYMKKVLTPMAFFFFFLEENPFWHCFCFFKSWKLWAGKVYRPVHYSR